MSKKKMSITETWYWDQKARSRKEAREKEARRRTSFEVANRIYEKHKGMTVDELLKLGKAARHRLFVALSPDAERFLQAPDQVHAEALFKMLQEDAP